MAQILFGDHGFGDLPPDGSIGPAQWDLFDLLCIHRGEATLRIAGSGVMTLQAGTGVLLFPDTAFSGHAGRYGARISVQHFGLHARGGGRLPAPLETLRPRRQGAEPVGFAAVSLGPDIERAIALAFRPADEAVHELRVAQLTLLIGLLQRPGEGIDAAAADPRVRVIHERLRDADLRRVTPTTMAKWVKLSPSGFRRWFGGRFGDSPKRYLIRRRVNRAMRLLRETRQPIKSVAAELGYAEVSHFYRDFTRHAGLTPAAYRSRHTVVG